MPHIQLEGVTSCNAKCVFCTHSFYPRPYGVMGMDLYRKIIDEVKTIPLIEYIYLVGMGETLLDPHLIERIRYIRAIGLTNLVGMFTNGFLLTPEKIDDLYRSGVTYIHLSINATSQEEHTMQMQVPGKYDHVCKMALYALEKWGPKRLQVTSVDDAPIDKGKFIAIWGPTGAVWRQDNFAGDTGATTPGVKSGICDFANKQINVMYDGRVSTCCMDPYGKHIFGDLRTQSIREIYNSEEYAHFRLEHSLGRGKQFHPCDECSRI